MVIEKTKGNNQIDELKSQEKSPGKKTIKNNYLFETAMIILTVSYLALALLAKQYPYFPIDLVITRTIQQITIPGWETLMLTITKLGNFEYGIVSVLLVSIFLITLKKNFNASFLILSVIGTETISVFFKGLIARPRPNPELINQFGTFINSDSFPSGHVLYYIGFYGFLLFLTFARLKKGLLKTFLVTLLSALLILIGLSRMYVGAHWFSDTLGAYLIGSVWLLVLTHFYKKLYKKHHERG